MQAVLYHQVTGGAKAFFNFITNPVISKAALKSKKIFVLLLLTLLTMAGLKYSRFESANPYTSTGSFGLSRLFCRLVRNITVRVSLTRFRNGRKLVSWS